MPISLKQALDVILYAPEQDCVGLLSPPGTGKSSAGVAAASIMGAHYWPVYAPTYEPVDARGLPMVKQSEHGASVEWAAPTCLPLERDAVKYKGKTVLVNLDDLFQAPPAVQRAFVRTFYGDGRERRVGDFMLYPNTRFMITGNREQDRAGVYRPDTYVNDRITYVEVEPSASDWIAGAIGGFKVPGVDNEYPGARAKVDKAVALGVPDELIAYVQFTKEVHAFSTEQRSFLSPRSLERLGRFIRAFDAMGINGEMLMEVASGTIGAEHATKFLAFRAMRNELPDVDAILKGECVELPAKTEVLYILATTIVRAAKKEHVPIVAKLVAQIADVENKGYNIGVEVSAYLSHLCVKGDVNPALAQIRTERTWIQWLSTHGKYMAG